PRRAEPLALAPCRLFLHLAQAALDHAQHDENLLYLLAVIALEQPLLDGANALDDGLDGTPPRRCQLQHDLAAVVIVKAAFDEVFVEETTHSARYGGLVHRRPARDLNRFDRSPNRDRGEHPPFMRVEAEM